MPKALITGISGFTGKYLAQKLATTGYEVFGISLTPQQEKNIYQVDLGNVEELCDIVDRVSPEVVAHLGGVSFVAHGNVAEIYHTNIVGTRNLLYALSQLSTIPKAVLLASSANVYGNAPINPIAEETSLRPLNDYAVSKLAMEKMAGLWIEKLPIFIVRPFNYTGIGQSNKFLIPKIINHFAQGAKQISLGNTDVLRDFSDVRTVADIYQKLISLAPTGKIINICSGSVVSVNDILNMMADIAGYRITVETHQHYIRQKEIKKLQGSNNLLKSLIGESHQIPLHDTLAWMFDAAH